jgi:thiosulfate/3-mercaptopyruvate sulfurtransferase
MGRGVPADVRADSGAAVTVCPLISVAELAGAPVVDTPPTVLDVRWRLGGPPGLDTYRAGHLPGAGYVDLDTELAGSPGSCGRHPMPAAADFAAAMRAAGVSADGSVVVYDDGDSTVAARAWWLLRYFGHDRVRVLDGGFRAWQAAGKPVSTQDVIPVPGDFAAEPDHMPLLDADAAAEFARSGVLLDARAANRYRGDTEPVDAVAGHIPGAHSAPTTDNVTAAGFFRSAAELRARFGNLGLQAGDRIVGAYCGSGVTAAHEVLALELAGIRAALYVGSWSEWIADTDRPVATGPKP